MSKKILPWGILTGVIIAILIFITIYQRYSADTISIQSDSMHFSFLMPPDPPPIPPYPYPYPPEPEPEPEPEPPAPPENNTNSNTSKTYPSPATVNNSETTTVTESQQESEEQTPTNTELLPEEESFSQPAKPQPTSSPLVTSEKPSAPTISTIKTKLDEVHNLGVNKSVVYTGGPIIITGKATADSTIKLYIYSDPIIAEVKADSNGNWTFAINQGLALGDHRIEAEVIDKDGNTSDKIEIASFKLIPEKISPQQLEDTSKFSFSWVSIILGIIGVVLIGLLIYLEAKRRKKE
jgi:hypothetical protein